MVSEQLKEINKTLLVEIKDVSKRYGFVWAVKNISFKIHSGEVVGLIGDNGAGKSTIVKMISGIIEPTSGQICICGKKQVINSPRKARELGIESFQQNLTVGEEQSVAANIFLGREICRKYLIFLRVLDKKKMYQEAEEVLERLNFRINVKKPVKLLSGGERQAVCITRVLLFNPKILIFDEPTTMLSVEAVRKIKHIIVNLRNQGMGILLISHNLDLILDVADYIVTLYQGKVNFEDSASDLECSDLITKMLIPSQIE